MVAITITGQDLHGVHIPRANLQGAELCGANFEGANLQAADIRVCPRDCQFLFMTRVGGLAGLPLMVAEVEVDHGGR